MRAGKQGSHDLGVHSRIAWNSGVDLRRRNPSYLVTRSVEASCQPAGGLRSTQERAAAGWQSERSGGCTQFGGATTHPPSPWGVPREAWNPCFKRVGAELLDAHQGQYPGDEFLSKSYNQAAQVPSSKVTNKVPRSPPKNSSMVEAFVSRMDSMINLPVESITATEIVA